jgi:HK97 family phage prohead protease
MSDYRARKGLAPPEFELRSTPGVVELRADNGSRRIVGTAVAYGKVSRPMRGMLEVFEPSAFKKSEGDGWPGVRSLLEHKPELLLASTDSGNLMITNSRNSLDYEAILPNTTAANDALALIDAGLLRHSSVGFLAYEDDFSTSDSGVPTRHVVAAQLTEASPVSNPAYWESTVGLLRSYAAFLGEDAEDVIRDGLAGNLRRYAVRTDNRGAPTPLEVANRMIKQDKGMSWQAAKARLEQKRPTFDPMADRARRLALMEHKMRIDADDIARLAEQRRQPQYYPQPDDTARQQAAQIMAEAIRRRLAQDAHDESVPVGFIDREAGSAKPLPQQLIYTPRPRPPKDGWLGP